MNKSRNVLLLKIVNESTQWAFSCRLRQPNGMPVEDVKVKPE